MQSAKLPVVAGVVAFLIFALTASAQPCPGFQNGNPANHLQTVSFYDISGNLIASCECQLTGNAFKCGSCLPSNAVFTTYQYVSGGTTVNCINAVVLPVELTRFEAAVTAQGVKLSWTTETERDNMEFILERSSDGSTFQPFATVKAAGNSVEPTDYAIEDNDPVSGLSYYRLSQSDINGKVTELGIVAVESQTVLTDIVLAPNPSNGAAMLHLPLHSGTQEFKVIVSNYSGKVVLEQTTNDDLSLSLEAGFYQVTVVSGAQRWSEKLVIVQD
jgi:hypothetical protein